VNGIAALVPLDVVTEIRYEGKVVTSWLEAQVVSVVAVPPVSIGPEGNTTLVASV